MLNERGLAYQMSFQIRSESDAFRLLLVLEFQFDMDNWDPVKLNRIEQLVSLWDGPKPSGWLEELLLQFVGIEELLKETTVEHEFAHQSQAVIEALGYAAKRLCGLAGAFEPFNSGLSETRCSVENSSS